MLKKYVVLKEQGKMTPTVIQRSPGLLYLVSKGGATTSVLTGYVASAQILGGRTPTRQSPGNGAAAPLGQEGGTVALEDPEGKASNQRGLFLSLKIE